VEMKRKITVLTLCALLFALGGSVNAQQAGKILRIGFLDPSTASGIAVLLNAFRQELSKLGWIEGKTSPASTDMRRGGVMLGAILRNRLGGHHV
jgi:ABC-type sugar transport system substrate-binding protein